MSSQSNSYEAIVVGAGPYGLSVATHLRHAGISTHVFGEPLGFWRNNMPRGMILRSPGCATHLSDPSSNLSFYAYAATHDVAADKPLPLEKFIAYGDWFQQRAIPDVDRRSVRQIDAAKGGFHLQLGDGETLSADRVVIATGLLNQEHKPSLFQNLPAELVSHATDHTDLSVFRGKHVAVIGRGQSATESAALLAENGAKAEIISRGDIHWLGRSTSPVSRKTVSKRLREVLVSPAEIGPFPLSWLVEVPSMVRLMPDSLREEFSLRCLKAAAAGWLKPRFDNITCNFGRTILGAHVSGDRIALDLDTGERAFDHVLLGTGYKVDIARLGILAPQLLDSISRTDGSPLLNRGFESSVPKLHFVGSYAVRSFGPLLRFIAGVPYAARSVAAAARGRTAKKTASWAGNERAFGSAATPNLWTPQ